MFQISTPNFFYKGVTFPSGPKTEFLQNFIHSTNISELPTMCQPVGSTGAGHISKENRLSSLPCNSKQNE